MYDICTTFSDIIVQDKFQGCLVVGH